MSSKQSAVIIKAAVNGGRSKAEHTAVPVSPDELAADVVDSLKAGANAIHLHVRSCKDHQPFDSQDESLRSEKASLHSENESLYAEDVTRTLIAVRSASPTAQIGITTGAWILPELAERLKAVAEWEVLPQFASVNFIEDGAIELARLLLSIGVGVEAGLSDANAAEVFLKSDLAASCIRVLLEPQEQKMSHALETVRAIERALKSGRIELPRVLHGTETTAWPMMDEAIARGYGVRIGFEDTLVLPDGRLAGSNAELVTEAVRRVRARISGQWAVG